MSYPKPFLSTLLLASCIVAGTQTSLCIDSIPSPPPLPPGQPIPIRPIDPKPTPGLRVPSRQAVTCSYDGEYLFLSFAYSEGGCLLTVTDNVTLAEDGYIFDSSVPTTLNIGYVSDASLTITTSLGHSYTGEIE